MRRVLASEHGHEIYRQRLFSRRPRPKGSRLRSADACSILASDLVKAESGRTSSRLLRRGRSGSGGGTRSHVRHGVGASREPHVRL